MHAQKPIPILDTSYTPLKTCGLFLKLDTETGRIWQVHYSIKGKDSRFEAPLNSGNIAKTLKKSQKIGRYALYQTQNMYNFILLDQIDGKIWQVQWSTDQSKEGIIPIDNY